MTTTINGKTPEEIKKGLEYCSPRYESKHWVSCSSECPFRNEGAFCRSVLHACNKKYIQLLEDGIDRIYKQVDALRGLPEKIQQLEHERDALLKALKEKDAECECCANADRLEQMDTCEEMDFDCDACKADCRCRDCRNNSNREWRGIQPAEKEAKDEGHTDHQPTGCPADPQGGKA